MNINKPNANPAAAGPRRAAPAEQPKAADHAKPAKPAPAMDSFKGTPDQYVIRPGDTLAKIAGRFGVSQQTLLELNPELTRGRKRTSTGDRIFAGETIRLKPAPSEADGLKDQLKKAQEASEAAQKAHEAAQQVSGAKVALLQMPQPSAWRSLGEAKKHVADADARLAKIPAGDAERPTFEGIVKNAHEAFEGMTGRLSDLAARNKTKVVQETGEDGKPVERKVDRELDDETLALSTSDVALADSTQKAKLIRNLYDGYTGGDEQDKILAILADAKGQGQLDETLGALKAEKTKTLFIPSTVFENLPGLFTDSRLDKLEQIVKGNAELEGAIARTREQRERQNSGY
ncbi:MAG TPA: LysM domain-containing protein [Pantanalinema sp.]